MRTLRFLGAAGLGGLIVGLCALAVSGGFLLVITLT